MHGCPALGNPGTWRWARDVPEYESAHKMCTNRPPATRFDGYDEVGFGPVLVGSTPALILWRWCFLCQYYPISNKDESPTIKSVLFVVSGWVLMCWKDWTLIIFDEMPKLNSWTCFLMYFRKARLDHKQVIRICGVEVREWPLECSTACNTLRTSSPCIKMKLIPIYLATSKLLLLGINNRGYSPA